MKFIVFSGFLFLTSSFFTNAALVSAGKTILTKGSVTAQNSQTKEQRKLKRRSPVYQVDRIVTGVDSKLQLSMVDGGLLTIKEESVLIVADYQFYEKNQTGSATIELIKGGLRSISGKIKKSGGGYEVKTPVGSIGIRGTHYEIQVAGNDVFLAVWQGNIDLTLNNQQTLSLGTEEDFSFAQINTSGLIRTMTQVPNIFAQGFSDKAIKSNEGKAPQTPEKIKLVQQNTDAQTPDNKVETDDGLVDLSVYNEVVWQGVSDVSIADLIAQRTGTVTYNTLADSQVFSSAGNVSNFEMEMAIDFDRGTVPGGFISFDDNQGNWYATYSGLINIEQLQLGITFGSHGNNRASGDISAAFNGGLEQVIGNFNLFELNNPNINANGSFTLIP